MKNTQNREERGDQELPSTEGGSSQIASPRGAEANGGNLK